MTQVFEEQVFNGKDIRDDTLLAFWPCRKRPRLYEDLEFRRCVFLASVLLTAYPDLARRMTIRHVRLIDCQHVSGTVYGVIVEEVLVDGLLTNDLICRGAVFKHVTLRGRIGSLMFSDLISAQPEHEAKRQAFAEANAAYYATVDWALDIREAEFDNPDLRGVPGRLVRRDPERHVLVTREKALEGKWRHLRLEKTWWPFLLETFLETNLDSTVLVLPASISSDKPWKLQELRDGLQLLRDEGVAEID